MRTGKPAHRAILLHFQLPISTPHCTHPNDAQPTVQRVSFICTIGRKLGFRFQICITKLPAAVLSISTMLMNSTLLTQTRQDLSKVDCYTS